MSFFFLISHGRGNLIKVDRFIDCNETSGRHVYHLFKELLKVALDDVCHRRNHLQCQVCVSCRARRSKNTTYLTNLICTAMLRKLLIVC
jgi:hypothetical protein